MPENPLTRQVAEFSERNKLSFLEGCVVKRVCRWRRGGKGVQDLEKAKHEIEMLIALEKSGLAQGDTPMSTVRRAWARAVIETHEPRVPASLPGFF